MTPSLPVVLADPPLDRPHPRVVVERLRGATNAGDGRPPRYVVRFVVDGRSRLLVDAATPTGAARRASAVVRARRPQAVWAFDATDEDGAWLDALAWRPLARAARDVRAAFVAWESR